MTEDVRNFCGVFVIILSASYVQATHLLDVFFITPNIIAAALIVVMSFEKNIFPFFALSLAGVFFIVDPPFFTKELTIFAGCIAALFLSKTYFRSYYPNDFLGIALFTLFFILLSTPSLFWKTPLLVLGEVLYNIFLVFLFGALFGSWYEKTRYAR